MIRVVVAEDSATARQLLVEIYRSDPEIEVVGEATNGAEAVELATRLRPDLISMDAHMPVMDGLDATREIMVVAPTPIIIVSSSVSGREVEMSLNAIRAGALMVMSKPSDPDSAWFSGRRDELVSMAKAMARVKVVRRWAPNGTVKLTHATSRSASTLPASVPRIVAIGASTGGPAALQRILSALPADFPVPLLVAQHISSGFVGGLAAWLDSRCSLRVKVAEDHEIIAPGSVYVAPDDRHLGVGTVGRVEVHPGPPIAGFRPSATHLFASVARAYGHSALGVILTGMGSDGVDGLRALKAAGGQVIAQDEASSVVYGMPREAVLSGVVDAVVGVDDIAQHLLDLVTGGD